MFTPAAIQKSTYLVSIINIVKDDGHGFALIMDELTREIQDEVPWCMLCADDIVLIDETRGGLNAKLERWRHSLESKGFRLSRSKTEYLRCGFSGVEREDGEVTMGGVVVPRVERFKYLGTIIEDRGDINEDISYRIRAGWQKWKKVSGILCDKETPSRLKGRVYRMVVRLVLLYEVECWSIKKTQVQRLMVAEMRMIWWMCGYTRLDRIKNVMIRERVGVLPLEDKLRETRLRWFGHVKRRSASELVRMCKVLDLLQYRRGRGRPKTS